MIQNTFSKKTFGYTFLPLKNSFEFFWILVIFQYKKNHQEFKRIFKGQKCITKGFQSNRLVTMFSFRFFGSFQMWHKFCHWPIFCLWWHTFFVSSEPEKSSMPRVVPTFRPLQAFFCSRSKKKSFFGWAVNWISFFSLVTLTKLREEVLW